MDAILYTSNSGFTAHYATLLGEATGLPVYPLGEAGRLAKGSEVIYLGWLMAGGVKGCRKALARFRVRALCAVGMGAEGSQTPEGIATQNHLDEEIAVFYLQGGFDITKLHGIYKFMMTCMAKGMGKKLSEKPKRTAEEDAMLEMMQHGGDCVRAENLAPILRWWEEQA